MDIENEAQSRRQQTTEKQPVTLQDVWDKLNGLISRIENKLDDHNSRFQKRLYTKHEDHHHNLISVNKVSSQNSLSQPTGLTVQIPAVYERSLATSARTSRHQPNLGQPNLGQLTSTKILPQRAHTFCLSSSTSDQKYRIMKRHRFCKNLKQLKGLKIKTGPIDKMSKSSQKKLTKGGLHLIGIQQKYYEQDEKG